MPNNRLFYAVEQVGISPGLGTSSYQALHGVQSVTLNTAFNLNNIFELGQISSYDLYEEFPDISMSISKVLDGYPLIYSLATSGAPSTTLAGRSNQRCMVAMSLFDDSKDAASGNAISTVVMSGMYVSSVSYSLPVQGPLTESVDLVCNSKEWKSSGLWNGVFTNTDAPLAGTVSRRQHVNMATSLWPTNLPGISSSGINNGAGSAAYDAHIQNVNISTNLGRNALYELGRKGPYFRYATFPVEVTCSIEMTSTSGDMINAYENATNITDKTIKIYISDGTIFDLGTKNKLQGVDFSLGDTGGSNASCTYNFLNYNDLAVSP